jgi:phage terminase large subunit-like protein
LPRGNGKTTLMAAVALHHLTTHPTPAIYASAASRDQARVLFEAARDMARELEGDVVSRHLELRVPGGFMRVLASDAAKVHGLSPTLVVIDELHAHKDAELYLALRTAMLKREGSKCITITTAGHDREGALGQLYSRALALPKVKRSGYLSRFEGPSFCMLEWRVPEDADVDDAAVVKRANPASWISEEGLAEQREAVADAAYRRYHANQWIEGERAWLPPGAWQACAGDAEIQPGEEVYVGVDIGGSRAASAVVWVTGDLRVGCSLFQGNESVLEVERRVCELADEFTVREVIYDPWRFHSEALRLAERGLLALEFPQTHARMAPASERLHAAIVEGRLTHPDDPDLNRHVASAVAKDTARGWRLDKSARAAQIDAVIALAMAVERAETPTQKVELLGWV